MADIATVYPEVKVLDEGVFWPTKNEFAAITTPISYASHCTDNWQIAYFATISSKEFPMVDLLPPSDCQLPGMGFSHSPATCLPGFTIVAMTKYRTPSWTPGGVRAWGASYCLEGFSTSIGFCASSITTALTAYPPEESDSESTTDLGSRNNVTVISTGVANMEAMLVFWQEADLEKFDAGYASRLADTLLLSNTFAPSAAAASTTTTATTTAATTLGFETGAAVPPDRSQLASATSTSDPEPGPEQNDTPSQSGLGTGIKAGIAVGAGVGAILLLLVAFLLYKRVAILQRRARLDHETVKQNEQPEFVPVKSGGEEEGAYTALPSSNARWSAFLAKL